MNVIDTHIHSWNFSRARYTWLEGNTSLLNRDYEIAELEQARTAAGVTGGVLVQAANNLEDTDYMLDTAAATPWLKGVVGWLPLTDPVLTENLLRSTYAANPYFKGVRHLIHDEADPRWLLQPAVIESLRILAQYQLSYDLVGVQPEHIETAMAVAQQVPTLQMIFDHCNQPPIAQAALYGRWGELMKAAAMLPQLHVKISGLGVTAQKGDRWTAIDIMPYVSFLLEHFGVDRACCGGDWPVCLLAGSYEHAWRNYKEVLTSLLDAGALEKVFYTNAVAFYRLSV
ncbi:amidohydrolase family protein [Paraflavitalea pollutisoli]|uniref:amidohydrolase family protein n=1 Tax=Paraflavitalea pollutisoli TaxID=3034143 RepID=UPI0023EE0A8F|nr:amidohydrolase family protein [Paraflavitalea sp. H1-2-19X]